MNSNTSPSDSNEPGQEKTVKGLDQTVESIQAHPEDDSRQTAIEGEESGPVLPSLPEGPLPSPTDPTVLADTMIGSVSQESNPDEPSKHVDMQQKTARNLETFLSTPNPDVQRRSKKKSPSIPEYISRYKVIRLLGEGAFGKVYEAHDPQLDRRVAIKVAKSLCQRPQIVRFLREARAAAQLRHPNIIPVYEYGQAGNLHIIVYEFVEGETLKAFCRRQRAVPMSDTVSIIRQMAEGLDYAHQQGIIHRDMKPDNVLVDDKGRAHIADFGCARTMDDETHLTMDGSILGTPMYMSPEQASGNSNSADQRTDIWSLGVMLYEMASGRRPFQGQLSTLLHQICNEDPLPIRKINRDLPIDIETICQKCLIRDPEDRFQSAQTLADELNRFENGEPILSRRIGPLKRIWMWAKRNQVVATLLMTVATTLVIGTIVSSMFAYQAYREQKNRALSQLNALTTSEPENLPQIFVDLTSFKSTILPQLRERLDDASNSKKDDHRIRMAILELEDDDKVRAQLADEMVEYLLASDAGDFSVCRMCLRFRKAELTNRLWNTALDIDQQDSDRRFRAAAALALYDPDSKNWESVAPDVSGYLVSLNQIEMAYWLESLDSLNPIRKWLKPTLVSEYLASESEDGKSSESAAAVLSLMYTDEVQFLTDLIPPASERQLPLITEALRINRSEAIDQLSQSLNLLALDPDAANIRPRSNLITALLQLESQAEWRRIEQASDPSIATDLAERLATTSTRPELILAKVKNWQNENTNVLSTLILGLGQYRKNQLPESQRTNLLPFLLEIFKQHSDARVHSCARWLLMEWDYDRQVQDAEQALRSTAPSDGMNWHVDLAGHTFAVFGPTESFQMGLDPKSVKHAGIVMPEVFNEPMHKMRIPRRFGICIHEVTIAEFENYESAVMKQIETRLDAGEDAFENPRERKKVELQLKNYKRVQSRRSGFAKQNPVADIDFFAALSYCRWLSDQQDLGSQLPTLADLRLVYEERRDFLIEESRLQPNGYRLPTASEWEFACRKTTITLFPFGQSPEFAGRYAWFATNSDAQLHPVGQLKPGLSGLFDVSGNVSEWCLDWYHENPFSQLPAGKTFVDFEAQLSDKRSPSRELRGGSFADEVLDLRGSYRTSLAPTSGLPRVGFRLARTYSGSSE